MLNNFIFSEGVRIVKFSVVAVIRTLLDILMWKGLVFIIQKNPNWETKIKKIKLNSYSFAHGVSTVISIIISYFANKILVFESNNQISNAEEIFRFAVVSFTAMFVSTLAMQQVCENKIFNFPKNWHPLLDKHWAFIAKLMAIAITMVINYVGLRLWTFA